MLPQEVECMVKAAAEGRHGARDRALALVMFYHGLRVSELIGLRMDDLQLDQSRLVIRRLKGSKSGLHPVNGTVLRALRRWLKERPVSGHKEVFLSERGEPLSRGTLNYLVNQWAERAYITFNVHPHMFRHACGYMLVNMPGGSRDLRLIQDYLGHVSPTHTARYTMLAQGRYEELFGM